MNKLLKAGIVAGVVLAGAITATFAAAQETIRFAVTDIDGMEALQTDMGPFKEVFEKVSGLKVEFFAVSGRTVAVEAMAAEQVDFVLTGPAEYVVFNACMKALPVVTWNRPDYYSNIIVLDASPEKSVADLKGQRLLLAAPTVKPETIDIVRKAFAEHGDELLAAVTSQEANDKFLGGVFTPDVSDADYDGIRKMYENVGVTDFLAFLE